MEANNQLSSPAVVVVAKEPRYWLNKRLGGLRKYTGNFEEQKNFLLFSGF
jgi:hypothetical protein